MRFFQRKNKQAKAAVLQRVVRVPPYYLAQLAARVHRRCALCQSLCTLPPYLLCVACARTMQTKIAPISLQITSPKGAYRLPVYPMSHYQHPLNHLISRFKEQGEMAAFLALCHLIYQLPRPSSGGQIAIVPVPTTPKRLTKRGFDPVWLLARALAYHWRVPIWQGVARRESDAHQRGASRQLRLENAGEFYLTGQIYHRQLIIVDDVMTTGATVRAIAQLLKTHSGSVQLLAVCAAHGTSEFNLTKQG